MTINERGFALVTYMLMSAMVQILSAIAAQSFTPELKVAGNDERDELGHTHGGRYFSVPAHLQRGQTSCTSMGTSSLPA
jgi:hypothetical protein